MFEVNHILAVHVHTGTIHKLCVALSFYDPLRAHAYVGYNTRVGITLDWNVLTTRNTVNVQGELCVCAYKHHTSVPCVNVFSLSFALSLYMYLYNICTVSFISLERVNFCI